MGDGDIQAIKRVAHTLKETTGSVGAIRMSELCSDLHEMAAAENLSGASSRAESLRLELEKIRPKLEGLGGLAGLNGS